MSRIGKIPVTIPSGVKAAIAGPVVSIEGPGGKLQTTVGEGVTVAQDGATLLVSMTASTDRRIAKRYNANYGSARALINNMVLGVTKGWKRALELNGVGYTAAVKGEFLMITAGFSHEVKLPIPKGVKVVVNKNAIDMQSADKETLGTFAASIRKVRKPEPYLGKGIKYAEEVIRRKAGKTAKK